MASRKRPSGAGALVSAEQASDAASRLAGAIEVFDKALAAALDTLADIEHPVERAKAVHAFKKLVSTSGGDVDALLEAAMVQAYLDGKANHGWYGYGALAEDLGVSRSRVQQIVTAAGAKASGSPLTWRERVAQAEQLRTVSRLDRAGYSLAEIVDATGLTGAQVRALLG